MTYYGKDVEQYLHAALNPKPLRGRTEAPPSLREEDRKIISDYLAEQTNLKPGTAKNVATYLVMLCRDLPFVVQDADTKTILQYVTRANTSLKQNTRRRAYPVFMKFIKWMASEGLNKNINLEKIKPALKAPGLDLSGRKSSMMLSGEDIKKLIEAGHTSRDRAIVSVMYEGSLRPIEIITATWDSIVFDKYGAQFMTSEKTGKPRYIRLIMSAPYLLAWKNDHPKPEPKTPVFVSLKSAKKIEPISQGGLRNLIYELSREALPGKDVFPYLMRHSRITALIADEVQESVVKLQAWGSVNSRMMETYLHLSNAQVDRVLLSKAGIMTAETRKDDILKPRRCSHCGKSHTPTSNFCDVCGTGLTEEARQQTSTITKTIDDELTEDDFMAAAREMYLRRKARS